MTLDELNAIPGVVCPVPQGAFYAFPDISVAFGKSHDGKVIANDVDPIELVVFLPALCRKMGIPYVIVKSSSRLGAVVHLKRTAIAVIQDVRSEDERELADLVSAAKANYLDKYDEARRHWGGGIRGNKSVEKLRKRVKAAGQSPATVAKESL